MPVAGFRRSEDHLDAQHHRATSHRSRSALVVGCDPPSRVAQMGGAGGSQPPSPAEATTPWYCQQWWVRRRAVHRTDGGPAAASSPPNPLSPSGSNESNPTNAARPSGSTALRQSQRCRLFCVATLCRLSLATTRMASTSGVVNRTDEVVGTILGLYINSTDVIPEHPDSDQLNAS